MLTRVLFRLTTLKRNTGVNKIENFRLINTVNRLSDEVDSLTKELYNLRQQQENMLDQIQKLKNIAKQNEERVDESGTEVV